MILKTMVDSIHSMIRNTLLFFIVLIISLYAWLLSGITLQNLSFDGFRIQTLYISLDKKLSLHANNILIEPSKNLDNRPPLLDYFKKFQTLSSYFESIRLTDIRYEPYRFDLHYKGGNFELRHDRYTLHARINTEDAMMHFEIFRFHDAKTALFAQANGSYHPKKRTLSLRGTFHTKEGNGTFTLSSAGDKLDLTLQDANFASLDHLSNTLQLQGGLKEWITSRIQSKHYLLNNLYVQIDTTSWQSLPQTLRVSATLNDASIRFHRDLPPILTQSINIRYKDNTIDFSLHAPDYQGRDLNGSGVKIVSIDTDPAVVLNLRILSPLDQAVQKILKAYDLDIPVYFKGKRVRIAIDMHIPFDENQTNEANVTVQADNGVISYKNLKLPVKNALFTYDTYTSKLRGNIDLQKGKFHYRNFTLPVQSGKVSIDNRHAKLKHIRLKNKSYDLFLNGSVDTQHDKLHADLHVKRLRIGDPKNTHISLKKKTLPLYLRFGKHKLYAHIPPLGLKLSKKAQTYTLTIDSLKKIKPYIKQAGITFDDGILELKAKSLSKVRFKGKLKDKRCFFYTKGACFSSIPFYGVFQKGNLSLEAFGSSLSYRSNTHTLSLRNLHIDLEKFLDTYANFNAKNTHTKPLRIKGEKSFFRYRDYRIVTDRYRMEIKPNGDFYARAYVDKQPIVFEKNKKHYTLHAHKVPARVIEPLLPHIGLSGGNYTIDLKGDPDTQVKGVVTIYGGTFKSKAFKQTAQVVESLPVSKKASITFRSFHIDQGTIEFIRTPKEITLKKIDIRGEEKTIVGKGKIDLLNKKIAVDLGVHIAKDLGAVIGSLPIVGYILMGKDKSIVIGLEVRGSIYNPKVQTTTAKDILLLPFTLLKRAIESPKTLFESPTP